MQPQTLLVFDIETVPDKHHHEGDGFPILPFHQVVAIAVLEAEINRTGAGEEYTLKDLRCGGEADYDEAKLVQGFFQQSLRLHGGLEFPKLCRVLALDCCTINRSISRGEAMGKVKVLVPDLELGVEDPLFITLFPDPDDGSVTVVQPPVMVELDPNHRQQLYANCISALEDMIQGLSPL